jgi:membrane protein implicated in regulation of membrane protease activity
MSERADSSGVVFFGFFVVIVVIAVYLIASETLAMVPTLIIAAVLTVISMQVSKKIVAKQREKKALEGKAAGKSGTATRK